MPLSETMPTAAKLVSAILLAGVAWAACEAIRPLMPEQTQFGWFNYVGAGIGLVVGWRVIGSRVRGGILQAVSAGLTGSAALVFWNLLAQSTNEMLAQALERRYDGPFEGLVAVFDIAVDYGQYLMDTTVLVILIGGGLVTALVANRVA